MDLPGRRTAARPATGASAAPPAGTAGARSRPCLGLGAMPLPCPPDHLVDHGTGRPGPRPFQQRAELAGRDLAGDLRACCRLFEGATLLAGLTEDTLEQVLRPVLAHPRGQR